MVKDKSLEEPGRLNEEVLLQDSVLADEELREDIRSIKKKYFRERSEKGIELVPSKLAYQAIKEAKKKDMDPSKVFEVMLNYSEVLEESLKEASERGMDLVSVAKVFKKSEEPYKILDESERVEFDPAGVMDVKGKFPEIWKETLKKAEEEDLNPLKVAETLDKMPGYAEEAISKASEKNLDPFYTALTLKFYPEIAEECLDLAFNHGLNPNEVAMTKDKFNEKIFKKALEIAGKREIEVYWTAKCFEEYTERKAEKIFPEAQEKEANPYIIARMAYGHGNRNRAEYDVNSD